MCVQQGGWGSSAVHVDYVAMLCRCELTAFAEPAAGSRQTAIRISMFSCRSFLAVGCVLSAGSYHLYAPTLVSYSWVREGIH